MKSIFIFLFSLLLVSFAKAQSHTYHQNITNFTNDNITSDYTSSTAVSDITYTASTSQTLTVSNGATVILDIGGNTLNLRGAVENNANYNAVEIYVAAGSTLKIIGNVDIGEDTDLDIFGTFIVTGNWTNDGRGPGDGGDLDLNVGENGMFAVGGNASFDYSTYDGGTYPQNIFIGGSLTTVGAPGDFSSVNVGVSPFGTASLDLADSNINIDLWQNTTVNDEKLNTNEISSTPLMNVVINSANGWGNKFLKVTCTDFNQNEIIIPDQTGNPITDIAQLQTLLRGIKWQVLDNTVKDKLVTYHKNNDGKTDHINSNERGTMMEYLSKSRVLKISFVDNITDTTTVYTNSSSRMSSIQTVEDINIDNDLGDLPIELIFFEARLQYQKVIFNWASAMEINNDYYAIEQSYDGRSWNEVSKISSKQSNSNFRLDYTYSIDFNGNDTFYRLKQVDFDGTTEYFEHIFIKGGNNHLKLYPTKLQKGNKLKVEAIGRNTMFLYTLEGKIIYQYQWTKDDVGLELIEFPTTIPTGQYIVVLKNDLLNFHQQIVLY
ncbi:hypothetical protein MY04_2495 [Flammeovirga sp. MY04]|uniref:hypothetical protein n=1 Tax=Flammeovirga sp. MY04 TaxID=1191459 RepID=UPI000806443C|nr:hypothetical protein [Flammeovirga sp. MY04]ANQ49864.1 hypothetical protein MY04_2495 [Flammeovirga sp. MY04]